MGGAAINITGSNFLPSSSSPMSTGGPGNYNWGNAGNPNPVNTNMWGSSTPAFPGGSSVSSSGVQDFFGLPGSQNYSGEYAKFSNELGKIYGRGVGGAVNQFLQSGAGLNLPLTQQTVADQIAAMQSQIMQGWGNISNSLGQAGIGPNSSVAALEESNYFSNAIAQENAITAQEFYNMWNQAMGNETNLLGEVMGHGQQYRANQPGLMDYLSFGLGILGDAATGGFGSSIGGLFGGKKG